ncbi:hypothetical protein Poli38472_004250 [Pythium oligandrum]|uniref:AD domain-containing protein n=1 Tax=Pythium oligandrum TaxID=41045 RepID=A0A8K1CPS1_PYTOL|nr:hypothetical protein Poli38472_004250 [Pythium oligandrum]|eukprot:TMW66485.1 hypothetical protein Poli38472_004250 [Pythium oligandrum]
MQHMPSELCVDGGVVGAKVRVVTSLEVTVEGVIFTLDPIANFLILEESSSETPAKSKTHIFQMDALKSIEVIEKAAGDANLNLPHISEDDLLRLEQKNKGIAERALASIGENVSAEAQAIFDALNKTMPCHWEGQNIRVMEEVLIKPPYQPQNCVSSNTQVLSRIKKVLEGEKNKLRKASKVSN